MFQAQLTERPLRTFRRAGQHQRSTLGGQLGERGDLFLLGVGHRHGEAVLVGGVGGVEHGQPFPLGQFPQDRHGRNRIRTRHQRRLRAVEVAIEELGHRGRVLGHDVDRTGLERAGVGVAARRGLVADLISGLRQELAVHLLHDQHLGEIGPSDGEHRSR